MPLSTIPKLPTTYHLLPHEKYAAARMLRKQAAHPDSKVVKRLQERWGPEGIVLLAAANSDGILAVVFFFIGVLLVVARGGHGAWLPAFYACDCLALLTVALSPVRIKQRKRAVKRFQASRRGTGTEVAR